MPEHKGRQTELWAGVRSKLSGGGRPRAASAPGFGGLAIGVLVGFLIGHGQWSFLSHRYELRAYVSQAMGLHEGSQVTLSGIPVGTVTRMDVAPYPEVKPLEIRMEIDRRYRDYIRNDSLVEVTRAGLLGENYIEISRGAQNQPPLASGSVLKVREETAIGDAGVWKRIRSLLAPGR